MSAAVARSEGWADAGADNAAARTAAQPEGRFSGAIMSENARGYVAVIPDIKRKSPKEGDLLRGRDPAEAARRLAGFGAPVLSVVTEKENYGGSPELLRWIVRAVDVPVLRKDFITSEDMLKETADLGAAAVLLICAVICGDGMLGKTGETGKSGMIGETRESGMPGKTGRLGKLEKLYESALRLGLEPLVEVHTAEEMELAAALVAPGASGARLIGINNRDILRLERDDGNSARTAALAAHAPAGSLIISESGIMSPEDAIAAAAAGANALLIGTALWQASNLERAYRSFRIKITNYKAQSTNEA